MSPRQPRPFEATQPSAHQVGRVEIGRRYTPPARRPEIDRDASRVQGWILGSSWAGSKTVDRKIAQAPGVVARLRAWLKGGRP
jgi:hypothetical protein